MNKAQRYIMLPINYLLGRTHNRSGNWERAARHYTKLTNLYDKYANWHYRLGMTYFRQKDWQSAIECFDKAIELNNKRPLYYLRRGKSHFEAKDNIQSEMDLQKAISLSPQYAAAHYEMGRQYFKKRTWIRAAIHLEHAIEITPPKKAKWFRMLGDSYTQLRQYERAKNAYEKALTLTNKDEPAQKIAATHYKLGYSLEKLGDTKEAEKHYKQAIKTDEELDAQTLGVGAFHQKYGRWNEAATAYKNSLKTDERNAKLLYRIGLAHERQLFWKEAINYYEKSLEHDYTSPDCHYHLGACYERLEKFQEAAEAYSNALARKSNHDAEWHFSLGRALQALGKFQEATEAYAGADIFKQPSNMPTRAYKRAVSSKNVRYATYYEKCQLDDKMVLYESMKGNNVSCNSRAIFEHLLNDKDFADFTHIWAVHDTNKVPAKYKQLKNVILVRPDSDAYMRYLSTAKYLVNNTTFPAYFTRKPEQIYLNTWHGTAFKTLGRDIKSSPFEYANTARNFLQASHLLIPNEYSIKHQLECYQLKNIFAGKVAITGYPRIDATINSKNRSKIIRTLGLSGKKKIVLYAPTWRGELGNYKIDANKIKSALNHLASLDAHIIFRGHYYIEDSLRSLSVKNVTVASPEIDTNDLLAAVDILITDYSSIFFDFLVTERPIIHYVYDINEYASERGLYFGVDELPGDVTYDMKSTLDAVQRHIEEKSFKPDERYLAAKTKFCSHDDGQATKRTVDWVFRGNDSQVDIVKFNNENKKPLLFWGSPFLSNGITTSFINLINGIDFKKYQPTILVPPSIANYPERLELLNRLPKNINLLPAVRGMNMTLDEYWAVHKFNSQYDLPNPRMWEDLQKTFKREYKRLVSETKYAASINFEGYSATWAAIMSNPPYDNTVSAIYQHNDIHNEMNHKYPYLEAVVRLSSYYDKIVSVSSDLMKINAENLAKQFDIDPDKFTYCDNIQNPEGVIERAKEPLDPKLAKLIARSKGRNFINIGRPSAEKDHAKLIRAFHAATKSHPDAQLFICGEGPLKSQLIKLTKELGLENRVHILGYTPNPMPLLKAADCFVLSSNYEGQPVVLYEALALDKPIISTDIPSCRNVLEGDYGLLVENSQIGLEQGIRSFLAGKLKHKKFDSIAHKQKALKRFYDHVISKTKNPARASTSHD